MAIGIWTPNAGSTPLDPVDMALMRRLLALTSNGDVGHVKDLLSEADIKQCAELADLAAKCWLPANELVKDQLESLIKLFTAGEMQLPAWQFGNKSPVIPLVKILKRRDEFSVEFRKWIKANTDNRYLPHGSLM